MAPKRFGESVRMRGAIGAVAALLLVAVNAAHANAPGSLPSANGWDEVLTLRELASKPSTIWLAAEIVATLANAPADGTASPDGRENEPDWLFGGSAPAGLQQDLSRLPEPVGAAVAHVIGAFVGYRDATQAALKGIEPAYEATVVAEGLRAHQTRLLIAAAELDVALHAGPRLSLAPISFPPVLAIDFAGADSTYVEDFALVIDVGGDDTYLNNAGGSASVTLCPFYPVFSTPGAAALLDFGGDDRYASGRGCGINGGAAVGAGFLLDVSGNDTYTGADGGVNGGAGVGVGLLVDLKGDDGYAAGGGGVNGGGAIGGSGLLLDLGGSDVYQGRDNAVNGGGELGHGVLVDLSGNDLYVGGNGGINGGAAGLLATGRGFLADLAGNDGYSAGSLGANGGGWAGVGFLYDAEGDDTYAAVRYGANGEGDPVLGCFVACLYAPAAGSLVDGMGRDVYVDLSGGSGVDRTVVPKGLVGVQVDMAG